MFFWLPKKENRKQPESDQLQLELPVVENYLPIPKSEPEKTETDNIIVIDLY